MTRNLGWACIYGMGVTLLACICGMLTTMEYVGITLVLLTLLLIITVFLGFALFYTVQSEIDHLDANHRAGANLHPAQRGATSSPAAKLERPNRRKS